MPIEEILYQAYLIVLSWPPQEETAVEGDNLPVQDLHHNPEANLLYVL
jgi:hypothetical protein